MHSTRHLREFQKRILLSSSKKEMIDGCDEILKLYNKKLNKTPVITKNSTLISMLTGIIFYITEARYFIDCQMRPETISESDFQTFKPIAEKLINLGEWESSILELFVQSF